MKIATFMLVVTNLWKVKMENCIAWKSGTARKSSLNPVTNQAKAKEEERVKLTKNVSAVDALVTSEQVAEPKLTSMEDPQNLRPKGKVSEIVRTKKQRLPFGTIDLGSFEVLSDHGEEEEDDESANETTEMMPPLPRGLWFERIETFCEKFRKPLQ